MHHICTSYHVSAIVLCVWLASGRRIETIHVYLVLFLIDVSQGFQGLSRTQPSSGRAWSCAQVISRTHHLRAYEIKMGPVRYSVERVGSRATDRNEGSMSRADGVHSSDRTVGMSLAHEPSGGMRAGRRGWTWDLHRSRFATHDDRNRTA